MSTRKKPLLIQILFGKICLTTKKMILTSNVEMMNIGIDICRYENDMSLYSAV
jgi:hypothetical protein